MKNLNVLDSVLQSKCLTCTSNGRLLPPSLKNMASFIYHINTQISKYSLTTVIDVHCPDSFKSLVTLLNFHDKLVSFYS